MIGQRVQGKSRKLGGTSWRPFVSGQKGACFLRVPLTWDSYDLRQGRGAGAGQSELPASHICSDSFSLKDLICQVAIFWGNVF